MGINDRQMIKRILAVLLCAFVFISGLPGPVFAEGEQTEDNGENIILTEAENEEAAPGDSLDDPDDLLESYMDKQLREELGEAPAKTKMRKAAASKRRNSLNYGGQLVYDGLKELIDKVAAGEADTAETSIDLTELFAPYITEKTVSGVNYKVITSASLGISSGVLVQKNEGGRTYWTFSDETKAKLYDFDEVIYALMADEPYAMYWYDKTAGVVYGISGMLIDKSGTTSDMYFKDGNDPILVTSFNVSEDYRAAGGDYTSVDTAKTGATAQAVNNAANIITENKSKTDFEKLTTYKDRICALTSYNNAAASDGGIAYGDPWQMIYVFDGNSATNVVCEGYSKAFQYLCDHSDFTSSYIECDTVSGIMKHDSGSGLHMWNILHMDDEENYIADLTNSDSGMIGSRGGLFISPAMSGGSFSAGYSYDVSSDGKEDITYTYDDETLSIFSESELTMSEQAYTGAHTMENVSYEWADDGSSCTATGVCADCGETIVRHGAVTSEVTKPATCTEEGTATYTATFRQPELSVQTKEINNVPALGHDYAAAVTRYAAEGVPGLMTYTCRRCGDHYTKSTPAIWYPADLPVVKISKPKAGKRKLTVRRKKVSKKNQKKIQGIEIQVATDPGFTNIVYHAYAGKKKKSRVVKGLQSKAVYYVRVRAYNDVGGRHVSVWRSKSGKVK